MSEVWIRLKELVVLFLSFRLWGNLLAYILDKHWLLGQGQVCTWRSSTMDGWESRIRLEEGRIWQPWRLHHIHDTQYLLHISLLLVLIKWSHFCELHNWPFSNALSILMPTPVTVLGCRTVCQEQGGSWFLCWAKWSWAFADAELLSLFRKYIVSLPCHGVRFSALCPFSLCQCAYSYQLLVAPFNIL